MIPSMISAILMIRETIDEKNLNDFISKELSRQYVLSKSINKNTITLVTVGDIITDSDLKTLNKNLSYYGLEGKRLIIKQDGSDISNLEKYINDIKNNLNSFATDNTSDIEKNQNNVNENAIFNELKSIYPEIKNMYMGYVDGETDKDKNIPVIIIYSDSENINRNIDNIENWFRVRLNSDDAKVYIENSIILNNILV